MTFDDLRNCDSFTFDVTEKDIKKGFHGNSLACPVALAINRTLGLPSGSTLVPFPNNLAKKQINIENLDEQCDSYCKNLWFKHSPESCEFVKKFDLKEPVEPITLTLQKVT